MLPATSGRMRTMGDAGAEPPVPPPQEYGAFARQRFPGPTYREHLAALHRHLRPATYLEIGVFDGDTLALAQGDTLAIGVDPQPRPASSRSYAAPTLIRRQTSDAFFAGEGAALRRDGLRFDLVFIDGLHLFEQVLLDFRNAEAMCHAGSVVVLHDTMPVAPLAAARERVTSYWCGDVWKVLPCLRRLRPDLRVLHLPSYPSGLAIVTGLDPQAWIPDGALDAVVAEYMPRDLTPADQAEAAAHAAPNSIEHLLAAMDARPAVPAPGHGAETRAAA